MPNLIPGHHKHLTLKDWLYIEHSLDNGKSFREIAKFLCKDPSTISKKLWNRGSFNNSYNFCIHRFYCKKTNACSKLLVCDIKCKSCHKCNRVCSSFEPEHCQRIERAPFVCSGCYKTRNKCSIHSKYDYHAKATQRLYEDCVLPSEKEST